MLPTLISSTPIPTSRFEHWRSPCTGPEAASQDIPDFNFPDFTPPTPSLPRTISELVFQMKETRDKVQELKHNYVSFMVIIFRIINTIHLRLDIIGIVPNYIGGLKGWVSFWSQIIIQEIAKTISIPLCLYNKREYFTSFKISSLGKPHKKKPSPTELYFILEFIRSSLINFIFF